MRPSCRGIIAALWGSSAQLATGPVAVVSLLTASALAPLAATGSDQFVALAIMLALLVGIIQLALGVFKLGVVVNFLSHPVIVGFTNAAAIIIGLSQLNKLFGVSMGRSEHFIKDIWGVLQQVGDTHLPTLAWASSAFAIMWGLKKYAPKLPGVLIAVALTTVASLVDRLRAQQHRRSVEQIMDAEVREVHRTWSHDRSTDGRTEQHRSAPNRRALKQLRKGPRATTTASSPPCNYEIELLQAANSRTCEDENRKAARAMRKFIFEQVPGSRWRSPTRLYLAGQVPQG